MWGPPHHNGVSLWACPGGPLCEGLSTTMEFHYGCVLVAHYVRASPPQWSLIMDVSWWPIMWGPLHHNGVSLWMCPGGPLCEGLPTTMESHYGCVLVAHYVSLPVIWSLIVDDWWGLALLLSNEISLIHGSRINQEWLCCPQFSPYSYQILCHVGGTSPPTWHKIW